MKLPCIILIFLLTIKSIMNEIKFEFVNQREITKSRLFNLSTLSLAFL